MIILKHSNPLLRNKYIYVKSSIASYLWEVTQAIICGDIKCHVSLQTISKNTLECIKVTSEKDKSFEIQIQW